MSLCVRSASGLTTAYPFADIDTRYPRSLPEILRLNRYIATRMRMTFGNVPIVASIGNNDIFVSPCKLRAPSLSS